MIIQLRRPKPQSRLLPAAIAAPAAGAAGVASGYLLFRRRPSGPTGGPVREAMTPNPRSISPGEPVAEAARIMCGDDVGSLPVVDAGRLVGVLTDRDITCRVVAEGRDPQTITVGDVASGNPVTVGPEQDLAEALQLMAENQVRRLPVVEHGRLVGMVAQADVALEAGDRRTGDVVEQVSQPSSTPRN